MAKSGKDAQASFRLPQSLYDQLKDAAGDRPIGDEMRRRLEASFDADQNTDPETRELARAMTKIANDIGIDYGRTWHQDAWCRDTLLAAIAVLVMAKAPRGEAKYEPEPEHLADLLWGENERDPSIAGRMLAMIELTGYARGKKNET